MKHDITTQLVYFAGTDPDATVSVDADLLLDAATVILGLRQVIETMRAKADSVEASFTALEQAVAAAIKEERERCAVICDQRSLDVGVALCASAIRRQP